MLFGQHIENEAAKRHRAAPPDTFSPLISTVHGRQMPAKTGSSLAGLNHAMSLQ
jgi:hypothetical protein